MKRPTAQDYATVRRTLRYLLPKAVRLANSIGQERPNEWAEGIATTLGLLRRNKDPLKALADYQAEYDAGH